MKPLLPAIQWPGSKLAEDDGIEHAAVERLQAHCGAAALLEIVERYPRFQRLGRKRLVERDRRDITVATIELQPAVRQSRMAMRLAVQIAESIMQAIFEIPAGNRFGENDARRSVVTSGEAAAHRFFQRGEFSLEFAGFAVECLSARIRGGFSRRRQAFALAVAHATQRRTEPIVIHLRDGIEFVIVAAGAIRREAQESLRSGADQVFQLVFAHDRFHRGALLRLADFIPRPRDQVSRGVDGLGVVRSQYVARELQADEFVIRKIVIEGGDDPIAIAIGAGPRLVALEALALAEMNDVEPMPGPRSP